MPTLNLDDDWNLVGGLEDDIQELAELETRIETVEKEIMLIRYHSPYRDIDSELKDLKAEADNLRKLIEEAQ